MASSKYTPELVEDICNAIAVHGLDERGWLAGNISKTTFYKWMEVNSEFKDAVKKAREEYAQSRPNTLKRHANKAFLDYLTGAMTRNERIVTYHPDGNQTEVVKTVPVGVPRWAVERVLGQPIAEIEAIVALAEKEIIPKWIAEYAVDLYRETREKIAEAIRGELPDSEIRQWIEKQELQSESSKNGITDETWAAIRSQVMGVDAKSVSSLSAEVYSESSTSSD